MTSPIYPFTPKKVTSADIAFGGNMKELLPPAESIPKEFWGGRTVWNDLVNRLFFSGGLVKERISKPGINPFDAKQHIMAVLRSFEPSHEYKAAACAYLFSIWFEKFEIEPREVKA